MSADRAVALRSLPSVDQILRRLADRAELQGVTRPRLTALVREALDQERARVLQDHGIVRAHAIERRVQRHAFHVRLRRVVPLFLMPPSALDERAARCRFDRRGHL